ncbi:MAG: PilZ domain-containing protein [Candidatus Omnitrophota bacterium]
MEGEKRDLKRWNTDWPARIRINYKNSIKNFDCFIKNINFKGLQVYLKNDLPDLKVLKCTIILPSSDTFSVKTQVAWKQVCEDGFRLYGLDFVGAKDSDKERIYQIINKNCYPELVKTWWQDTA